MNLNPEDPIDREEILLRVLARVTRGEDVGDPSKLPFGARGIGYAAYLVKDMRENHDGPMEAFVETCAQLAKNEPEFSGPYLDVAHEMWKTTFFMNVRKTRFEMRRVLEMTRREKLVDEAAEMP